MDFFLNGAVQHLSWKVWSVLLLKSTISQIIFLTKSILNEHCMNGVNQQTLLMSCPCSLSILFIAEAIFVEVSHRIPLHGCNGHYVIAWHGGTSSWKWFLISRDEGLWLKTDSSRCHCNKRHLSPLSKNTLCSDRWHHGSAAEKSASLERCHRRWHALAIALDWRRFRLHQHICSPRLCINAQTHQIGFIDI